MAGKLTVKRTKFLLLNNFPFMNIEKRIQAFVSLGILLENNPEKLKECIVKANQHNPWFTLENQKKAIKSIAVNFLARNKLEEWTQVYPFLKNSEKPKMVGLILAGNIPLVGFHDFLCVLISGNIACIKCSDKDPFLLPFLAELLIEIEPDFKSFIHFIERLDTYDAVIATGSNNSSRYFEHYFASKPNIIRKNRQAIAVLNGKESLQDLMNLGEDIFTYFGLGCRNVSKIYVPENFDFTPLLDALHSFNKIILHHNYKNNFDYQSAIWLLNKVPHFMTGSILVTEEKSIASKIATLHYEFYKDLEHLKVEIENHFDQIQCIVGNQSITNLILIPFGQAQTPSLSEYADGVDTLSFLGEL
ncbi:MAG: hypothetical protein RLZZ417_1355 [Bacteroidota bacterium]|jgi:hypothetical protein